MSKPKRRQIGMATFMEAAIIPPALLIALATVMMTVRTRESIRAAIRAMRTGSIVSEEITPQSTRSKTTLKAEI